MFGNTNPQHGYQDHTQWSKVHKHRNHRGQKQGQSLSGEQVGNLKLLPVPWVNLPEIDGRKKGGENPDQQHESEEEHGRIGELVTGPFDEIQCPTQQSGLFS